MAELQHALQVAASERHERPQWAGNPTPTTPQNLQQITQRAIDIYLLSQQSDGEMGGIGWWQTANGYSAIALHDYWSGTNQNYNALAEAVRKCERTHSGLINEFNDDTLWWAICCLHLYAIGGDPWFLSKAKGVWQHIHKHNSVCGRGQVRFRDQDMEGACYWTTRPGEGQINSISSGLFAELGARLAIIERSSGGNGSNDSNARAAPEKHPHLSKLQGLLGSHPPSSGGNYSTTNSDSYLESARCSLGWILRCRYRPNEAVVLDGIRLKKNEAVDWAFTYTTGVTIGVCALLYEATRDREYMTLACHIAQKSMRRKGWVEDDGVLTEHGAYGKGNHDPGKNDDAVGFKAVLVRHLGVLYEVILKTGVASGEARETAALIREFVNLNFRAQMERNTNGNGQYGPWWSGPFEMPTSHSQMAVLDVMAAVMIVNRG